MVGKVRHVKLMETTDMRVQCMVFRLKLRLSIAFKCAFGSKGGRGNDTLKETIDVSVKSVAFRILQANN